MATRMAEDLWRLEIPLVGNPLKNLNSYLLLGERNLLIDTGFRQPSCREAMERELDALGVDRDRTDIFLTHLHSDHTGLAPELIRPGCRIYISESDGRRMTASGRDTTWQTLYSGYVKEGFSEEQMAWLWDNNPARKARPKEYHDYVYLRDGQELCYGGGRLRCILTPGHTPGHLCLYDPQRQWLFSGDHVLFHITPNICRWSGVADSLGDYLKSLEAVRTLPVSLILPAHRQDTGNMETRIEELKAHHARRVEETASILAKGAGQSAYEVAGQMTWSIRCKSWEDFPLAQKFFAVGEAMSHLDYLIALDRAERMETAEGYRYRLKA